MFLISNYFKVPEEFNFIETIDLFFKIHKIFNLKFHSNIKQLMTFLEKFVYEISVDENLITGMMRALALDKEFE